MRANAPRFAHKMNSNLLQFAITLPMVLKPIARKMNAQKQLQCVENRTLTFYANLLRPTLSLFCPQFFF